MKAGGAKCMVVPRITGYWVVRPRIVSHRLDGLLRTWAGATTVNISRKERKAAKIARAGDICRSKNAKLRWSLKGAKGCATILILTTDGGRNSIKIEIGIMIIFFSMLFVFFRHLFHLVSSV